MTTDQNVFVRTLFCNTGVCSILWILSHVWYLEVCVLNHRDHELCLLSLGRLIPVDPEFCWTSWGLLNPVDPEPCFPYLLCSKLKILSIARHLGICSIQNLVFHLGVYSILWIMSHICSAQSWGLWTLFAICKSAQC